MGHALRYCCFFLFLCVGSLTAQEHYAFSPIDCRDGLSGNRVRNIIQLRDGRMAINANEIVSIYDGTSFRYFHYDKSCLFPLAGYDGYHRVYTDGTYIFTKDYHRLMAIHISEERFEFRLDSLWTAIGIEGTLSDFFMDDAGAYWILTTDDCLWRWADRRKPARIFLRNVSGKEEASARLLDLCVVEQQVFLFYDSGLMVCYDEKSQKELYRNDVWGKRIGKNFCTTLLVVPDGPYLYYLMNGGKSAALRFDWKRRLWETVLESEDHLNVISIARNGDIWITCAKGLWVCDGTLAHRRYIPTLELVDGQKINTEVSTVCNDNQGGTWIGTYDRGILYYHPDRYKFKNVGRTFFPDDDPEREIRVSCFAETEAGELLVGTHHGLLRYAGPDVPMTRFPGLPRNLVCQALTEDSRQQLWLATTDGVFCLQGEQVRHYSLGNVAKVFEASDGQLYVCSYTDGLGILDPESGICRRVNSPEGTEPLVSVWQLKEYGAGQLIGVGNEGLFIYDCKNRVLQPFAFARQKEWKDFYNLHHCSDVCVDRQGNLWIATLDGLLIWDPRQEKLARFYMEDGLVNNSVQGMVEDRERRIWLTTSYGISCVTLETGNGQTEYLFSNYSQPDGVIGREFLERSVYVRKGGDILMGGIDGFNVFENRRSEAIRQDLRPLFVGFRIFGKEVEKGKIFGRKEMVLEHDQNFISLEFSALNYINSAQTHYRYRLKGVDPEWREMLSTRGSAEVSYANLAPGRYDFEVYGANGGKQWSSQPATLQIVILAPWWASTFAFVLYGLLAGLSVFGALSVYLKRKREKMQKAQEEKLNRMKFQFFTNISHELRTPLTLITVPLETMLREATDAAWKAKLHTVYRNARELLSLVNQLLDFRRLEMDGEKLLSTKGDIVEFIESVGKAFEGLAREKGIVLEMDRGGLQSFYLDFDREKIQKILNNLLSNAFKYTPSGGSVRIAVDTWRDKNGQLYFRFSVADTGIGIPRKSIPHLFERFYQVDANHRGGSGIGLHVVKEYVELHAGKVEVESEPGQGSLFRVSLPVRETSVEISPEAEGERGYTILLVDDHPEFRQFMAEWLSKKYRILEAGDGAAGLAIVKAEFPDLVISDVMMPGMDGFELCRQIKSDLQVSHIPVILLTARSADESKLCGYESGADEYLSKPFNIDILWVRIQHLIDEKRTRQQRFAQKVRIDPGELAVTSIDEQFLEKVCASVDRNLDHPEYSVQLLSQDVGMERTVLYRKLHALTGQTPSDFIRSVRLKKAALLLQKGYPVGEVAVMVGFNTPKYFTKYFKQAFGQTPSRYKSACAREEE